MSASKLVQSLFIAVALWCLATVGSKAAPAEGQGQEQDIELQLGQEVFDELKARAEIIESSPLYDQLKPIADAFSAPGGNVYVVRRE
jgi:hypothetical protein